MRILMVCLGNICRSPIAEGVMRHKIKQLGLDWTVESAGTENYHIGEAPHRYSQAICLKHGIDISGLRASKFTADHFASYDKIYAMATDVLREMKQIGLEGHATDMTNADLFLNELHRNASHGNTVKKNDSVPDPYYGAEDGYRIVYEMIDKTCDAIIKNYS
jgi:protein-tyrosine phosphatase